VRGLLARYLTDTSSGTTLEYGFIAAGVALAIAFALSQLGAEGRFAARALLRFRNE
jgi:Flp pilus assembly pilin Flp